MQKEASLNSAKEENFTRKLISIIIRTKNEADSLEKVLKSVIAQKMDFDSEIILVDTNSTDNTRIIAEKYNCQILNVDVTEFSWGKGLNVGLDHARGQYCVLLSAHSYLIDENVIAGLVRPLIENKNVAATYGGQLPIHAVDPFEEIELAMWFPTKNIGNSIGVAISDANACLKKEVWNHFKFNESLSSYEDAEWAERVQSAGYSTIYVPKAACYHSHKIKVKSIYRKWYWRQRAGMYVQRNTKLVQIVVKFNPNLIAFALSSSRFLTFFSRSLLNCLRKKYFNSIWKTLFYEFVRIYAMYMGIRDGIVDLQRERTPNKFSYYQVSIPAFLTKFGFIEN